MDGTNGRRGIGTLLRALVDESALLVRGEARLARLEVGRAANAIGRGVAFVALGSALLILGALALVIGLILLFGDQWLPADRYWLAALIITIITASVAALLAKHGLAQLPPSHVAPRETATTLEENLSWTKQPPTSGAKSK